jgi:hypothetical protein
LTSKKSKLHGPYDKCTVSKHSISFSTLVVKLDNPTYISAEQSTKNRGDDYCIAKKPLMVDAKTE